MLKALRNVLVQLMLLLCMPALIAHPIDPFPPPQNTTLHQILSYDEIIELIHKVESEEFDNSESSKEIAQVNKILTLFATAGSVFEGEEKQCFQNSIASLLNDSTNTNDFCFQISDLPSLVCDISSFNSPQLFNSSGDTSQICDIFSDDDLNYYSYTPCCCIENVWKKTKKFLAKYKTEIIIGAAVVVAVVIIFSSMGTAAAPVAALAGIAEVTPEPSKPATAPIDYQIPLFTGREEALLFPKESPSQLDFALHQYPINIEYYRNKIKNDLHNQVSLSETFNDSSLIQTIKEHGSAFTHACLSDIVKECDFIAELGTVTQKYTNQNDSLLDVYNNIVDNLHEKIDVLFSTNMGPHYSYEARKNDPLNECLIGIVPSPGAIIKCGHFLTKSRKILFTKAGKVFDRGGYTIAGRSLMKKGYRTGSVYPKPVGTIKEINDHGQKILNEILTHPGSKESIISSEMFGEIIEVSVPDGRTVWFTSMMKMIGFREPRTLK